MISSEGRIVIVSSALCHMFGFRTSDELIGKNVSMLVPLHLHHRLPPLHLSH